MNTEVSIFTEALQKSSHHETAAILDQACAEDPHLSHQVEGLHSSHDQAGGFLNSPPPGIDLDASALTEDAASTSSQPLGSTVGPYKLLEQIGEGGMGIVYMAEQERPVRRKVAVKIIKPGM